MSTAQIGRDAWSAFWANILAPGSIGLYIIVFLIAFGFGFAFKREGGAIGIALRALSALLAAMLLMGLLGSLGVNMNGLTPMLNWLLQQIQAPLYLPEH